MAEKQSNETKNESIKEFETETTMDELLGEVKQMRTGLGVDQEFVDHLANNAIRKMTTGEVITGTVVKVDTDRTQNGFYKR